MGSSRSTAVAVLVLLGTVTLAGCSSDDAATARTTTGRPSTTRPTSPPATVDPRASVPAPAPVELHLPKVTDAIDVVTAEGPDGPVPRAALGFDPPLGWTGAPGPQNDGGGGGSEGVFAHTGGPDGLLGERAIVVTIMTRCAGSTTTPSLDGSVWSVRSTADGSAVATGPVIDGCAAVVMRGLTEEERTAMLRAIPSAEPGTFLSSLADPAAPPPAWVPPDLRSDWQNSPEPSTTVRMGLPGSDERFYAISTIVDSASPPVLEFAALTSDGSDEGDADDDGDEAIIQRCETQGSLLVCGSVGPTGDTTLSLWRDGIRLDVTEGWNINASDERRNETVDHDAALVRLAQVVSGLRAA